MEVPRGTLLPLGLFLCLGLLLSSAGSESSRDNCIFFDEVYTYGSGPDIRVNSNIYESNKIYTVMIPGTKSNSSVILRAVDQSNNPVGLWQEAYQQCNDSALYHMKNLVDIPFMANWSSPDSLDIAAVKIHHHIFVDGAEDDIHTATPSYALRLCPESVLTSLVLEGVFLSPQSVLQEQNPKGAATI
ncbi:placenta-expressed transcript 1 protein [Tamandua tetradactyla]|uniref:placenta-expressed transcript 1 protein n=1 Tax=Tamandua tetradactyla TaxID=48850 RepID=UPI0040538E2B